MDEKSLRNYEKDIIKTVVNKKIKTISFRNPHLSLGDITRGISLRDTLKALKGLKDAGILSLKPKKACLFFYRSVYKTDLDEAGKAYHSIQ